MIARPAAAAGLLDQEPAAAAVMLMRLVDVPTAAGWLRATSDDKRRSELLTVLMEQVGTQRALAIAVEALGEAGAVAALNATHRVKEPRRFPWLDVVDPAAFAPALPAIALDDVALVLALVESQRAAVLLGQVQSPAIAGCSAASGQVSTHRRPASLLPNGGSGSGRLSRTPRVAVLWPQRSCVTCGRGPSSRRWRAGASSRPRCGPTSGQCCSSSRTSNTSTTARCGRCSGTPMRGIPSLLSATPAALGQLRVRSIEEAQARIVDAVRRLQAGGEIIVKPWPHLLDG